MDNRNDNQQSSIDNLSAENKKWLDELLHGKQAPKEMGAGQLAAQQPSSIDSRDAELEKILAEDWSSVPDQEEPAIAEVPVAPAPEPVIKPAEPVKTDIVTPKNTVDNSPAVPAEKPQQTGRPKRKDGYGLFGIPHILATVIWLVLILSIGVSLGRVLWVCCADVMAFGKESQKVTITITENDNIETISKKLGDANLVRYPKLFQFFAEITGKDEDIGVGTFTLYSHFDYNAMVNNMISYGPKREVVDIMFPEGANCAQIFKLLAEKNVCSLEDLEEYAANGELKDYWFLEGVPRGDKYCLEGYMAPDTYSFYTNDDPKRVIEKFLNEFDDRFTDKMKEDFVTMQEAFADKLRSKGFGSSYIKEHTLTLHQVVTLASVIQKEAASDSECYDIGSVFYNRLANPDILSLGADATVYYALGDYFGLIDELTAEHLDVDSPYNTRKYKGIPPGPICNMGVHALYAALEPNDTNYHYFVYDPAQSAHRFAVTYSEHIKNVNEVG